MPALGAPQMLKTAVSFKDKNTKRLAFVVAANFVAFAFLANGEGLLGPDWQAIFKAISKLVSAGLGLVVLSVVNGLLSPQAKERLVFWRWTHPLPGCRAFTVHAKQDPRINLSALRAKLGAFPKGGTEQNSAWYKLYKTVESEAAVTHEHKEYLFTRDYAALAALMLVGLGPLAFWHAITVERAITYVTVLTVQYLVVRFAAVHYGQRLVTTVLAIKSVEV
jgi:hypothetical protein